MKNATGSCYGCSCLSGDTHKGQQNLKKRGSLRAPGHDNKLKGYNNIHVRFPPQGGHTTVTERKRKTRKRERGRERESMETRVSMKES